MQNESGKLLITGGHPAPALAVIDHLLTKEGFVKKNIVFVGKKYAQDNEKGLSFEYKEIKTRGIKFYQLQAGRLTRVVSLQTLRNIVRIPMGFIRAHSIVRDIKPSLVVSFGGYLALPIAYWAHKYHIPIITHEQTLKPGLASSTIAKWAKKIFVSFPESVRFFPRKKTEVSGNPIRASIFLKEEHAYTLDPHKQTLYITGGNLGSHSINMKIKCILPQLLERYNIIHQVGNAKEFNDYEQLSQYVATLAPELQNRYVLKKNVFDDEIGSVFHYADLVIGRSGANTFFDIIAVQKPAIFIPLPWSARGEQRDHAKLFKKLGLGEWIEQSEPPEKLLEIIRTMMANLEYYHEQYQKLGGYGKDASSIIAKEIRRYIA